jgi:hypothetical protein
MSARVEKCSDREISQAGRSARDEAKTPAGDLEQRGTAEYVFTSATAKTACAGNKRCGKVRIAPAESQWDSVGDFDDGSRRAMQSDRNEQRQKKT